jgi:predicted nuclease of predicted toxin-antitoxin system
VATFLFDNDISPRIARAIQALVENEHVVMALKDEFPSNAADVDWLPAAGRQGWIVVSRDAKQRRRDVERNAIRESGARTVYIRYSGQQNTLFGDAARIVRCWPKIATWAVPARPGECSRLNSKDEVEILRSP